MTKRFIIAFTTTLILISLLLYANSIHRYDRNTQYDLTMLGVLFFAIINIILIIVNLINLIINKKSFKSIINLLPIIVLFLGLCFVFNPMFKEEELVPVVFYACYEGTQNTSVGYFRKDSSFEIHATGVFGYNKWHLGKWRIKKDTLFLNYSTVKHNLLPDTSVIVNDILIPIQSDTLSRYKRGFYLGLCKGEN